MAVQPRPIPGTGWRMIISEERAESLSDLRAQLSKLQMTGAISLPDAARRQLFKQYNDIDKRMRTWILHLDLSYMKQNNITMDEFQRRLRKLLFTIPPVGEQVLPQERKRKLPTSDLLVITNTHDTPSSIIIRYQPNYILLCKERLVSGDM